MDENKENIDIELNQDGGATGNPFAEENFQQQDEPQAPEDNKDEKYEKLNNQYIRLAADFDNYRKRHAQELESALKYGAEETLKKMIEVLDNFDRAQKSMENIDEPQKVKESFDVLHNQLFESLQKLGLEKIEAEGKEFDPNFHEAVMQTPTSETPEHTILQELQKGYKLADKVLRPSLVNVAVSE